MINTQDWIQVITHIGAVLGMTGRMWWASEKPSTDPETAAMVDDVRNNVSREAPLRLGGLLVGNAAPAAAPE